jgi:hypothetical protein
MEVWIVIKKAVGMDLEGDQSRDRLADP